MDSILSESRDLISWSVKLQETHQESGDEIAKHDLMI